MGRTPCCEKKGLKRGAWTPKEDKKLAAYVEEHGNGSWRSLPAKAGLQRCGKSCRLRWINYLKPDIKRGNFSLEEDHTIIQLHALLGNKWSLIAAHLHKRTDNEIKNYWNSHLKKRLVRMGIDPITHKPKANTTGHYSKDAANMSHMAQWESARLQAEARESMLQVGSSSSSTSSHPTRLTISKIPPKPSPPPCLDVLKAWQQSLGSLESPLTNHPNNNTMYNTYAIMLATDNNDLHSPVSTLSFPESKKLPTVSSTDACQLAESSSSLPFENNGGYNNVDTSSHKMTEAIVCSTQDDDIMVAVEAFRAARGRDEGISDVPNGAIEGLNNDMPVFECLAEEYGYGNFNLEAYYCWNISLLNENR